MNEDDPAAVVLADGIKHETYWRQPFDDDTLCVTANSRWPTRPEAAKKTRRAFSERERRGPSGEVPPLKLKVVVSF
jgi:hypothetical protein